MKFQSSLHTCQCLLLIVNVDRYRARALLTSPSFISQMVHAQIPVKVIKKKGLTPNGAVSEFYSLTVVVKALRGVKSFFSVV